MMPHWLVDFSTRFKLYGGKMQIQNKEMSVLDFKERLAAIFKDLAENERVAHRSVFNPDALSRADVWDRAASITMGLPSGPVPPKAS